MFEGDSAGRLDGTTSAGSGTLERYCRYMNKCFYLATTPSACLDSHRDVRIYYSDEASSFLDGSWRLDFVREDKDSTAGAAVDQVQFLLCCTHNVVSKYIGI